MGNSTPSAAAQHAKSIPLNGRTVHVWRNADAQSSGWRVVRDADGFNVAEGVASTESDAWAQAIALSSERRTWDYDSPVMPEYDYPGCPRRIMWNMERVSRAAQGIGAIAEILFRHNLESNGEDCDPRPLRMQTAEGLIRALGCLADVAQDAAHECAKGASHG